MAFPVSGQDRATHLKNKMYGEDHTQVECNVHTSLSPYPTPALSLPLFCGSKYTSSIVSVFIGYIRVSQLLMACAVFTFVFKINRGF